MRSFDFSRRSNQAIVALVLLAGLSGLAATRYFDSSRWVVFEAAGVTFLCWLLTRELDPDRDATALVAAVAGAAWAVAGRPVDLLMLAGFGVTARLLLESTGRRPLNTDLFTIAAGASLISFRPLGFVAGFGLAVAIYVDDRLDDQTSRTAVIASLLAAGGAGLVATTTDAFPQLLPDATPWLVAAIAGLALATVLRDPPEPTSQVDSRRKSFVRRDRLHDSRVWVGVLCLAGSLIGGDEAGAVVPAAICLGIALASSEIEHRVRARL